jgi:hypothetical protein
MQHQSVSPIVAGIFVGLILAFPAGILFAKLRKGWGDVRSAKAGVPKARKTAWKATGQALLVGGLLVAVGVGLIGAHRHDTPAQSPSPTPILRPVNPSAP